MRDTKYRLEMVEISKHFGGVKALENVSLHVEPGEIHALIGENGAGKSTLMKILSGAYSRDHGKIFIDGKEAKITNPKESKDLGVAIIYQEFMLAPDLTVAENIFIDKLSGDSKFINWKKLRRDAKEQLLRLGFDDIDPAAKCGTLRAYQQVVEICKCLTRKAKILVFDEPTAVLTFSEIRKLFEIIQKLKNEGVSIVYISHRLEEIFELSQHITVLKDGTYVDTVETSKFDKQRLVNMMVGRELTDLFPARKARIGETVLRVENLHAGKMVQGVSFEVRAGEVLGFNGLIGSGRTETMRAIFGADKKKSGHIHYLGKEVRWKDPKQAIEAGFGLLPEDRKKQGLLLEQSIRMNTTLACLKKVTCQKLILQKQKEKELVQKVLADIQTKYGNIEDNANSLSGGNQQKVALAKWIAAGSRCMVFDEPTRGVDVGAKTEIYKVINNLAEQGVAVILISSEMPEIIGMCDRVLIMHNGKISGEAQREEITENVLIKYSMGVN